MKNKSKNTMLPKLRFTAFNEDSGWDARKLKDVASRITAKNQDNLVDRVLTNSALDGVVDQSDYFDKDIANKGNLDGYTIVAKGDYVYNPRISTSAPVGPISKNNIAQGVMSPLYTVFRFHESENEFYEHYFKSSHWHDYIYKVANTGARHDRISITSAEFMDLPLPYTHPNEQQKIVDCLNSIEEWIRVEERKINSLKAHKKGLLVKLFPDEGENQPHYRFKDFTDAMQWKKIKLGSVADFISGGTPSKSNPNYWNGDIPWISASSMHNTKLATSELKITQKAIDQGARLVKKGTLLILVRGSMLYKKIPMGIASTDVSFNQDVKALALKTKTNVKFLLYQLLAFESRIFIDSTGIGAGKIDTDELKSLAVFLPDSITEQKQIAELFESVDILISQQEMKISSLGDHKKSLLQQLFPTIDEVMG